MHLLPGFLDKPKLIAVVNSLPIEIFNRKLVVLRTRVSAVYIECNARVEKNRAPPSPGIQRLYTRHSWLSCLLAEHLRLGIHKHMHAASLALCPTLLFPHFQRVCPQTFHNWSSQQQQAEGCAQMDYSHVV